MEWLRILDTDVFRFFNVQLINPVFDVLMPFVSGNLLFFPILFILGVWLICKGGARGRVFLIMVLVVLALGDGVICHGLKHWVDRPRPFSVEPWVHHPGNDASPRPGADPAPGHEAAARPAPPVATGGNSMPSSHAANWFSATIVALLYYRRSWWGMLPMALLVSYSRLYLGVHYPSDIIVGGLLGAGYAAAIVWGVDALWRWAFRRWFPLWWRRLPSLLNPEVVPAGLDDEDDSPLPPPRRGIAGPGFVAPHVSLDQHWIRMGYVVTFILLVARFAYLASGTIQLTGDEAYQWLWSKHLALSFYSKPPMIAYVQRLSTMVLGDTGLGVRFFSPVIGALTGLLVLRFFAREVNARAGFLLLLAVTASPLLAVGSVLMTVDPLSVLFWTAAMLCGWRAIQESAGITPWLWVGWWMGLGFLSKYTELFQWLCWAVVFCLLPSARRQLRRPGPYLAVLVAAVCALPVLIWNQQHGWVTVGHVAGDAQVGHEFHFGTPEFLGTEAGLLNPVFFVATVWAAVAFWRTNRHNPRLVYFFSMGAPIFLAYLLHSFHARVIPNWIAPSVLPLFCVMAIYWDTRWRLGSDRVRAWFLAGLAVGLPLVVLAHNTDPLGRLIGRPMPVKFDVLHRARGWDDTAFAVDGMRQTLAAEGKPVFIIADHYGMTGEISFYLPEAREAVSGVPLVYCLLKDFPENQFYFWPGYEQRKGQNAVFVRELDRDHPLFRPPPARLVAEFESVTEMGVTNVMYHGRYLLRPLQVYACRGLK